jgi:hypothetical protein
MEHVDIYFFPDPKRGDAASQMQEMVTFLGKYNVKARAKAVLAHTAVNSQAF